MAKQALIICAGGMSSSMIAKKTMALLQEQGEDIEMDAVGVPEGQKRIEADNYDLYLCLLYTSPSPRDATLSRMPSSA